MEGLEGRGFSRYMHPLYGGAYAIALLSGDPHWAGTKNVGLVGHDEVRDKENNLHVILGQGSKRLSYALIYGCERVTTHARLGSSGLSQLIQATSRCRVALGAEGAVLFPASQASPRAFRSAQLGA
jgi:hypothetical protein